MSLQPHSLTPPSSTTSQGSQGVCHNTNKKECTPKNCGSSCCRQNRSSQPFIPIILALPHVRSEHLLNGPVGSLCLAICLGMESRRHSQDRAHHPANFFPEVTGELCVSFRHYHSRQPMQPTTESTKIRTVSTAVAIPWVGRSTIILVR